MNMLLFEQLYIALIVLQRLVSHVFVEKFIKYLIMGDDLEMTEVMYFK